MLFPGSGALRHSVVFFLFVSLLPAYARVHRSGDWADTQYAAADKLHDALEARPDTQRTHAQYQRVIDAYRRVYLGAPSSGKADPSAAAAADVLTEMGEQFNNEKALRSAIKQYEFLRKEYPGSKARFPALFSIGQIYKDDLDDSDQATAAFQEFVRRYPHNSLAVDARKALTEIANDADASAKKTSPAQNTKRAAKKATQDDSVQSDDSQDAGIVAAKDPDESAKAGAENAPQTQTKITSIHYTSTENGAQVVINLGRDVKFDARRLDHPDRIFFNLFGAMLASSSLGKDMKADNGILKAIRASDFKPGQARVVLEVENKVEFKAAFQGTQHRLVIDLRSASEVAQADAPAANSASNDAAEDGTPPLKTAVITEKSDDATPVVPSSKRSQKSRMAILNTPEVREAKPTADGDRSLIRALGLKIGKIVIDPGHGGHDTGTIGPHGLLEKDLVLDVSRRLGKLLQARLGADVIFTRSDDTFIPLEGRTAIANQEEADLFISVHANSSHDSDARGVETYYLNFTSSPEALEVAARENAGSDKSIHELQDLVKTIALKEKIEESREFASDVESALHNGLSAKNPAIRDRGVKKAPFIVLIGANMPSILAEISFVSNPSDERKLLTPEYRQKIAESLYKGISKYVNGLSGIKVASKVEPISGKQ
ncbi:MAG TPA: N-acetylmuramoyl-L-alanine amidase [Terriglobales bacterium]